MMTKCVFVSLIILTLAVPIPSVAVAQPPPGDLLLYYDEERNPPGVTAYNPTTGEKLELPVTTEINAIKTSGDGRIAYPQDNDIWILDVLNAPNHPTNITQTPDEAESLLDWVAGGRLLKFQVGSSPGPYLLYVYDGQEVLAVDTGYHLERYWNDDGWYVSFQEGNTDQIHGYVWNGQEHIAIALPPLPDDPVWHTLEWTPRNHLFVTVGYQEQRYGQSIGSTDIFYWNGNDTRKVAAPLDAETFMLGDWHTDGQLILYTQQDHVRQVYVWDGVSFTPDGMPDTAALTAINGPNERFGDVEWMPDGRLAIVAFADPALNSLLGHPYSCTDFCGPQVFLWDRRTLRQVTHYKFNGIRINVHDNGYMVVSDFNGLVTWGLTVFDSNLRPVLQTEGPYAQSQWSADGNLAYCVTSDLLVWNGQDSALLGMGTFSRWLIAPSWSMGCSAG